MIFNIEDIKGREPLVDYPWRGEVDRLLTWLIGKDAHIQSFCFDLIMSASFIDATSGIEKSNFLALEASSFAVGCTSAVVFADDPTYEAAKECNDLIFIRSGNEETSMLGDVTWQNAAYIFCFACGVDP